MSKVTIGTPVEYVPDPNDTFKRSGVVADADALAAIVVKVLEGESVNLTVFDTTGVTFPRVAVPNKPTIKGRGHWRVPKPVATPKSNAKATSKKD